MPAAKYIQHLSDQIEAALKTARENVEDTQRWNKQYYDKQRSVRQLEPGDLFLILMLTDNVKWTAIIVKKPSGKIRLVNNLI